MSKHIIIETFIYCKFIFTITISLIRLIEICLDIVLSVSCKSRRVERSLSTHSEKHVHRLSLVTEGFFIWLIYYKEIECCWTYICLPFDDGLSLVTEGFFILNLLYFDCTLIASSVIPTTLVLSYFQRNRIRLLTVRISE